MAYALRSQDDDFQYGFNATGADGGGGVSGSQPGSQSDGQGAGITPLGSNDPKMTAPSIGPAPSLIDPTSGYPSSGNTGIAGPDYQNTGIAGEQNQPPSGGAPQTAASPAAPPDFGNLLNQVHSASSPQDAAQSQDKLARTLYQSLSDAGHKVSWNADGSLMVDGRPYTVASSGSFTSGVPSFNQAVSAIGGAPQLPSDLAAWRPSTAPLYTPGTIGTEDIPNFTYSGLMSDIGGGDLNAANRNLITQLQQNPSTMSPQVVDTMKAQMKDTLAEQQRQEEEDLKGFGAASGISDSGWLAAQRAASRRMRDIGIAQSNQNLDIQAAKQQQADRLAAAGVGLQAGEAQRANVQAAANTTLQRAAETGSRMQLQESVKQAAAQLGLSQQQVMSNFIQQKEQALLQKYGIDLGAQIDLAKLGEQSQEFQQDLLQKMAMLDKQLGAQMSIAGGQLGFQYDTLDERKDEQNWQRYLDITGAQKPAAAAG